MGSPSILQWGVSTARPIHKENAKMTPFNQMLAQALDALNNAETAMMNAQNALKMDDLQKSKEKALDILGNAIYEIITYKNNASEQAISNLRTLMKRDKGN